MNGRIKMMKYLISFILFFFVTCLYAQQLPYKVVGLKEGLPQSTVFRMSQDHQGYMWLATQGGLCKYDGSSFLNYTMYDGIGSLFIKDISFDDKGQLWLATIDNGISCFDGLKFTTFNKSSGLLSNEIRYFKKTSSGDYFICSIDTGVVWVDKYLNQKIILTPEGEEILYARDVHELANGNIWIGWNNGVIELIKDQNYKPIHKLKSGLEIIRFYKDGNGDIWAGGTQSLFKFTKDSTINYSYILPEYAEVWDILEDTPSNSMYFATTNGILLMNKDTFKWINTDNGLVDNELRSIYKDKNGMLWAGSFGAGAILLQNKGIDNFGTTKEIAPFATNTITQDKEGNIWIGTNNQGLLFYDSAGLNKAISIGMDKMQDPISSTYDKKTGDIFFGEYEGRIVRIKDKRVIWEWNPPSHEPFRILCINYCNGNLFIPTQNGCYVLNEKKELKKIKELGNLYYSYSFTDMFDNVWILGDRGKIFKWKDGVITNYSERIGTNNSTVVQGVYDPFHKIYWFCTYSGLIAWNGNKSFKLHSKNFIHSDSPWSIAIDLNSNIWLGHSTGIEMLNIETRRSQFFGYDQGFTPIETNSCAAICDKDGNIWFGTVNSASRIRVNDTKPKKSIVHLWIQNINVNGRYVFVQDLLHDKIDEVELAYNQNNISLDLTGICFDNAKDVTYKWYMSGLDSKWTEPSKQKKAIYSNMPPGEYIFRAQAFDPNGFESEQISIRITIKKPIWNQWWFYTVEIILMAFIIFLSFRFTSNPSHNKLGNLLTLVSILIIFEGILIYVSDYVNKFTGGVPIFQLIMNVILAGTLHPLEQAIRKFMRRWAIRKRSKLPQKEDDTSD